MAEHENETLRCIYCQRTITWPMAEMYPHQCVHCGRWTCYTADRPLPRAERRMSETPAGEHGAENDAPRECPDKACAATTRDRCRYPGWVLCGHPIACTGSARCPAPKHVHGCYADVDGKACDDPSDHHGYPIASAETAEGSSDE